MDRIVVVGASAAGMTAAESLRRRGHTGSVTVIGDEVHLPYDRPPLSKEILRGTWEPEKIVLRTQAQLDDLGIRLRLGVPAAGLDRDAAEVVLADGARVPYDGLVVATGVAARTLPGAAGIERVHYLRSLDDAVRLRDELDVGGRLLVIGAGFLGAELAASAREQGKEVILVEPLPAPMVRQVGDVVGGKVATLHRERGVDVRLGTTVTALEEQPDGVLATLSDGTTAAVASVAVAVGSVPNTAWLAGTGLDISDGLHCDATLSAAPGIVAAGDVAAWPHPGLGRRVRVEHRTNATESAMAAASTLLGAGRPYAPVPFFWSDQYDVKLQVVGSPLPNDELVAMAGGLDEPRFAGTYVRDGRIVAGLTWNMPRESVRLRRLLGLDLSEALAAG